MSITAKTTINNTPRHITLVMHLNDTATIEVEGDGVSPRQVLEAAQREVDEKLGFIAVGANGSRRLENVDDSLQDGETTLVADQQRTNG